MPMRVHEGHAGACRHGIPGFVGSSRRSFLHTLALAGAGALIRRPSAASDPGPVIDFHSHYWPPEYLDNLRASSRLQITTDSRGNARIHYPGNVTTIVRGHTDLDFREGVLEENGVDVQVLTFSNPGTQVEPPPRAVAGAELINDALASIVRRRNKKFRALATLPLNDAEASARELERAVRKLGLPGAMILSNVNGVPLSDPRFTPVFEAADELGAVVFVHPTYPAAAETMTDYRLTALVGFPTDTTLAAARLVLSGVVERFPRIRWALANLGGTIPFLAERLDRGYDAFKELRANATQPPSAYLRSLYYDTVNFDPSALRLGIEFAGAGHLLAGSDYPQAIGSLPLMQESIAALSVTDADRNAILGGNAATLLGL